MVSFRKERYVPFGGPDGGNGGRGGAVIFRAQEGLNTLASLRGERIFRAEDGAAGGSRQRTGRSGKDRIVPVPVGTIVRDAVTGEILADLDGEGAEVVVVEGGHGGRGNMSFRTSTNQAPRMSTPGGPRQERRLHLELKLLADVGVMGFPNAGKSTFVARVSAARPRVADYPFTTLVPHLGVVVRGHESWVVADIPGLVHGAAEGAGLGHQFLRHVQRTRVLLHLVAATDEGSGSVVERYQALRQELEAFDPGLARKREVVALTKLDAVSHEDVDRAAAALQGLGVSQVLRMSAVTGQGVDDLLGRLDACLREDE